VVPDLEAARLHQHKDRHLFLAQLPPPVVGEVAAIFGVALVMPLAQVVQAGGLVMPQVQLPLLLLDKVMLPEVITTAALVAAAVLAVLEQHQQLLMQVETVELAHRLALQVLQ
jgi:hypothetical protein